jgi:L-ribulokinase
MFAATASGVYSKVEDAMQAMGQGFDAVYYPDASKVALYAQRYQRYIELGSFIESNLTVSA